jgi:sensor histidine kinase YesM
MTIHDFIFTNEKPAKYYRHIAFWLGQFIFWGFWASIFFSPKTIWENILFLLRNRQYFILDMSYTYVIVYYLSPKFLLRKRIAHFFMFVLIFTAIIYILFILSRFWINGLFNESSDMQLLNAWYISMNFIINGPPVICVMFLTLKMCKNYYIKMQEKLTLVQENTNAELQLLKAQVHPHFLFNTLNNIYSFALSKSPKAGNLVLKLSDTLRYMITDCEATLVPLEKELKMIEDYIGLEKVRYGNRLNLLVQIDGDPENKLIAPLLLIPFVENCFKHGASIMRGQQWINLKIDIQNNQLDFQISNSKPAQTISGNKKGIGLANVQKRLELLYPEKFYLKTESTNDTFNVHLQVDLIEKNNTDNQDILNPQS